MEEEFDIHVKQGVSSVLAQASFIIQGALKNKERLEEAESMLQHFLRVDEMDIS